MTTTANRRSRWWRKDNVPIYVMTIILSVLSVVSIVNMNRLQDSVEHTDLVAECVTPGTRCFQLAREREAARLNVVTAQNKCLIVNAVAVLRGDSVEQMLENFDLCVEETLQN